MRWLREVRNDEASCDSSNAGAEGSYRIECKPEINCDRRYTFVRATRPRDYQPMERVGSVLGEASRNYPADVFGDYGGARRRRAGGERANRVGCGDGAGGAGAERCGSGGSERKSLRD